MEVSDEYKHGFLIGLLEGEGCVSIQKTGKTKKYICGQIIIVNTDKNLIDTIDKFLKSLNFKYSIRKHHTENYIKKHNVKEAWRVVITNRMDFEKLLSFYHMEGSTKKQRIQLLMENRIRKLYKRRL